jgi:hypothetical protein
VRRHARASNRGNDHRLPYSRLRRGNKEIVEPLGSRRDEGLLGSYTTHDVRVGLLQPRHQLFVELPVGNSARGHRVEKKLREGSLISGLSRLVSRARQSAAPRAVAPTLSPTPQVSSAVLAISLHVSWAWFSI